MSPVCSPEVHPYLKAHPGDLLNLRPWPELGVQIGECPGCGTTISVKLPEVVEVAA